MDSDGEVEIVITGTYCLLSNMLSGQWTEVWECKDGELKGEISCSAHYFEDGNIQFNYENEYS